MGIELSAGNGFAPIPPERDAQGVSAQQFLSNLFEFEYCEECKGDMQDHIAVIDMFGNWFAFCLTS